MSPCRPLVLTTRPGGSEDPLVAQLVASDIDVVAVPTVVLEDAEAGGPLDLAVESAGQWDWVVVTSRRGVDALAAACRRRAAPALGEWRARWAAVGNGTADALAREGVTDVVVPHAQRGGAVAAALAERVDLRGVRLLLPRADAADVTLPEQLTVLGALVRDVVAYRTVIGPKPSAAPLADVLANPLLGLAVVASSSAVEGLIALAEAAGPDAASRLRALPIVSIGPSTSVTLARFGLRIAGEAERPTVVSLAAAVMAALSDPSPARGTVMAVPK